MRKYKNISSDGTVKYIRSRIGSTFESLCALAEYDPAKVVYATEYADGSTGVYIACDGALNVPNLWKYQALKIDKDGNKQIKYYQLSSDNTDLPFVATGWENGVIVERYIAQYPDPPSLSGLDTDLQEKLTAFATTHGLDLPDHDMSDPKLFCVSVNYDGDTPTNIDFHIKLV